jgi:hypothetical protein
MKCVRAEFSAQVDLKQPWFWAGFSTLSWVVLLLGCVVYTHVKHSSQPSSLLAKVCCKKADFGGGCFVVKAISMVTLCSVVKTLGHYRLCHQSLFQAGLLALAFIHYGSYTALPFR